MRLEVLNQQIISCRKCARLVNWREAVAIKKRKAYRDQEYWGRPVPGFGDKRARILVVGLAPGAHGSNRTGRQFTGDASGRFLFPALFRAGFASRPDSTDRNDGLMLRDLYLTASCRCAPPENKPTPEELDNCQDYLEHEVSLIKPKVVVCLGRIAFERMRRVFLLGRQGMKFAHAAAFRIDPGSAPDVRWILCSYHPSQQNTATGKLTRAMFDRIWEIAGTLANGA